MTSVPWSGIVWIWTCGNQFFRIWNSGAIPLAFLPALSALIGACAISDWSMSNHTAPTSEIVQSPWPRKRHKGRKIRKTREDRLGKNPRRSEREKEVSNCFVPPLSWASLQYGCLCHLGGIPPEEGQGPPLHDGGFLLWAWLWNLPTLCSLFSPCRRKHIFQNRFWPQWLQTFKNLYIRNTDVLEKQRAGSSCTLQTSPFAVTLEHDVHVQIKVPDYKFAGSSSSSFSVFLLLLCS